MKSAACKYFTRYRSRTFYVHSGRTFVENVDKIRQQIEENRHISSYDISLELPVVQKTVLRHLHKVGYKKKLDVSVQHELIVKNLMN